MEITGYSRSWIYELIWGYNRLGPESLGDHRQQNKDKDPLLNDLQQAQLWQVLQQPPADGGLMVMVIWICSWPVSSKCTDSYAKAETLSLQTFQKPFFCSNLVYYLNLSLFGTASANEISMVSGL